MDTIKRLFYWISIWFIFILICSLRLILSFNFHHQGFFSTSPLAFKTLWILAFAGISCIVIFISVIGSYLTSLLFLGKMITSKRDLKDILYIVYIVAYGIFNFIYAIYMLVYNRDINEYEREIVSILLAILISMLIMYSFNRYKMPRRKTIEFSIIILFINAIMPVYFILFNK